MSGIPVNEILVHNGAIWAPCAQTRRGATLIEGRYWHTPAPPRTPREGGVRPLARLPYRDG